MTRTTPRTTLPATGAAESTPPAGPAEPGKPTDPTGTLARLGWDQQWQDVYSSHHDTAAVLRVDGVQVGPARVVRTDRGACDLLAVQGPVRATWGADVLAAVARDPLGVPSTGDWVVLATWPDGRDTVEVVLPRRTTLSRLVVGGSSHAQVLATNVDAVAVVEALVPDPDPGRVERLLALAWESGAAPHLVLTKADLCSDGQELGEELGGSVAPGVPVHVVATTQDEGLEALRALLGGGATVAFAGASGVGKSTLLNALVGAPVMGVQALGAVAKGRHTTVTRELHLAAPGGCVIDTPGLRSVGLVGEEGLDEVFADVVDLAQECRFRDCAHAAEPGCAVRAAVEDGSLPERRLESWRKLQREAAFQARRSDARLAREELAKWKAIAKAQRARTPR